MVNVLVTGSNGFCGHHFIDHILTNTDWQIFAMTNSDEPNRIIDSKHYQNNKERVVIIKHNLLESVPDEVVEILTNIDYVINLASLSHIEDSIKNPLPFIRDNLIMSLNVFEFCKKTNIKKIIQFSTDEIYGAIHNDVLHKEWSSIVPSNPYSASKAAQEDAAIAYWKTYGLPLIITNTMTIFGERQGVEKYIPKIAKTVINGDKLTVHSKNGEAGFRSYLHARNAADATLFILKNVEPVLYPNSSKPERINIVSAATINNLDLAKKIASIIGKELDYELIDVHTIRPGQDQKYGLDGTKLISMGYRYPLNFDDTLESTINWMIKPENREFLGL